MDQQTVTQPTGRSCAPRTPASAAAALGSAVEMLLAGAEIHGGQVREVGSDGRVSEVILTTLGRGVVATFRLAEDAPAEFSIL